MGNIQYYNLIGGLNTIQGIGSINQSNRKTESPDMQNVEFFKLGGLKSMEGNTQFGTTLVDEEGKPLTITLGYEYIYGNNKYLIVCTNDGQVWEYSKVGNTFNKIYKFPTATARHSIASFNFGIIISNGVDDLVYYNRNRHQILSGTISTSVGSNEIVGDNTKFKTELHKGDYITIGDNGNTYVVDEVKDDTHLIITTITQEELLAQNYYLDKLSIVDATYRADYNEETQTFNIEKKVRGLALQTYNGRIFVGGNDGTVYYSEVGLIHGWELQYGAGAIPTFYNDNSDFTALGLWDKYLVIFKRERCYLLDGNDVDDANWVIEPFSDYTCDSQQSWIDSANGVWLYSRKAGGIYPVLSRTIYNANYQGSELSQKIRPSLEYINEAKFDYIFPVYHPKKKYLMFYIPTLLDNGSNSCFIWDLNAKAWLLRKVPQNVNIAFRYDGNIYIGTTDGKILKEFSGTTFDGKPIEFYWKSPWFSFGQGTDYMSTREIRLKLAEEIGNNFIIRNRRDGRGTDKERTIKDSSTAFIGLDWDIGYIENEINPNYGEKVSVYQVTDKDTNYYTLVPGDLSTTVPIHTKLYKDNQCKEVAGYTGLINKLVEATDKDTADTIKATAKHTYQYGGTHQEFYRYTDGGNYLWIDWEEVQPKTGIACRINKGKSSSTPSYYCYRLQSDGKELYVSANDVLTRIGTSDWYGVYARNADGSIFTYNGFNIWIVSKNSQAELNQLSNALVFFTTAVTNVTRVSGQDVYSTNNTNTGDSPYAGTVVGISDINGTVITLSNGDKFNINTDTRVVDGNDIESYYYSNVEEFTLSHPVYSDKDLRNQIGTFTNVSDGRKAIYITATNQLAYNPRVIDTIITYDYEYYNKQAIEFTYTGEVNEIPNGFDNLILPTEFSEDTITDTVWANEEGTSGDSWVITRHIVKRFPLPDQYFQTLQIEFSGNTIDNQLALYGFEIDGIDLEEVRYR